MSVEVLIKEREALEGTIKIKEKMISSYKEDLVRTSKYFNEAKRAKEETENRLEEIKDAIKILTEIKQKKEEEVKKIEEAREKEEDERRDKREKELIEKELKLNNSRWLDFENDDYCTDECRGWDGDSTRCDCGNRRVSWRMSADETSVYPETY